MIQENGRIEVICGSMFSGKSEELIRRIKRAEIAKQRTQLFKPSLDNRYGYGTVNGHDGGCHDANVIESSQDIPRLLKKDTQVAGIDEAQFLDEEVVDVVKWMADKRNMRILVAGLNLNFRGEPFHPMPELMAEADILDELHAICVICGKDASRTQRMISELQPNGEWFARPAHYNDPLILVAADIEHAVETAKKIKEYYEARCRHCHEVPGKPVVVYQAAE